MIDIVEPRLCFHLVCAVSVTTPDWRTKPRRSYSRRCGNGDVRANSRCWRNATYWQLLVPELKKRGHPAVATDIAEDDPRLGLRE